MTIQNDQTINIIRAKNLVAKATPDDVTKLIEHIDALETFLDDKDDDDTFGIEGWRHAIGLT